MLRMRRRMVVVIHRNCLLHLRRIPPEVGGNQGCHGGRGRSTTVHRFGRYAQATDEDVIEIQGPLARYGDHGLRREMATGGGNRLTQRRIRLQ